MFESFFSSLNKPRVARRSMRLQVETLEGRDMPSTLPAPVDPALLAVHSTPPPVVHVSIGQVEHGVQVNEHAKGSPVDSGAGSCLRGGPIDWSHADLVQASITRSIGEEIPQ